MSSQRFDAREVLRNYVAILGASGDGVIRDAAELGHPKDTIRTVLQHCITSIEGADERAFLKQAYLGLGNFQALSEEERKAVGLLAEIGSPGSPGSDLHEEQAKRISEVADSLQGLLERVREDTALLEQELGSLPMPPDAAPLPQQEPSLPQSAAAMPPSTASSAPVT
jgi:hypothetical protein